MNRNLRRGGLVGPVILIFLGVVLLLNTMGVLAWSVWDVIIRIWPVLLIAWGLDLLIGRRSIWGSLLVLVLIVAVLAGALWLSWARTETGQILASEEIVQALGGATQSKVVIAPAVASLKIEALEESNSLIEGVVRLGSGERVARDFAIEKGSATFTLRSEGVPAPFFGWWGDERTWELGLNPEVPVELEVSLGAGQSYIDLTGLVVRGLDVSMGVGGTTITLPEEGSVQAEIDGAIGETVVVIPQGMAARIHFSTALVSRDLPDGYQGQDDLYASPGYESAENRVDLEVGLAIGRVAIRHPGGY